MVSCLNFRVLYNLNNTRTVLGLSSRTEKRNVDVTKEHRAGTKYSKERHFPREEICQLILLNRFFGLLIPSLELFFAKHIEKNRASCKEQISIDGIVHRENILLIKTLK